MATITVRYTLTKTGQKSSLLSGGSGDRWQEIEVDAAENPAAAELAEVSDKKLQLTIMEDQDAPLTSETVSAAILLQKANVDQERKEKAEELAKRQADYYAIFEQRKTETIKVGLYKHEIEVEIPAGNLGRLKSTGYKYHDWQQEFDNRPDVAAWIQERQAAVDEASRQSEQNAAEEIKRLRLQREEEERKAEEAENAFRKEHGLSESEIWYQVEQECLTDVPCYEGHKRGKNWLAIVKRNPKAPGGLDRDFQEKCKGEYYYSVSGLSAGNYIEFGADYYSGGGRADRKRKYGQVTRVEETFLAYEPCGKSDVQK